VSFSQVLLPLFFAAASAGYLGAPAVATYAAAPAVPTYAAAPAVVKTAVAAPLATSYANTYKVSVRTPVVAAAAPLAYTAPAVAAPLAYGATTLIH